jgi:redox-sensitive bicupin YhaK (pirin superfamily)
MTEVAAGSMRRRRVGAVSRLIGAFVVLTAAAALHASAQAGAGGTAPVIDNERVTVWDITLTPGRPHSIERHQGDFVTLFLAGGKIRTVDGNGKTSVALRNSGDAVYSPQGAGEREELISGGPARLIVVELKDHPVPPLVNRSGYPAAFPRPGSKKVLDNDRVVVWNYTWTPGVPTPMHYHDKDVVVAYRYDGSVKSVTPDGKNVVTDYTAGTVSFNKGDRAHFEELVKGRQSAIVLELK